MYFYDAYAVQVSDEYAGATTERNKSYWSNLWSIAPRFWASFLWHVDLDGYVVTQMPNTEERRAGKLNGLSAAQQWVYYQLQSSPSSFCFFDGKVHVLISYDEDGVESNSKKQKTQGNSAFNVGPPER